MELIEQYDKRFKNLRSFIKILKIKMITNICVKFEI